jgi:anti-sigma regulatory factor (Ser/Thr protein kinase)
MIAENKNTCTANYHIKRFITPDLRPLRALFFLFVILATLLPAAAQRSFYVDSLIKFVAGHPENDSVKILMMHRISYILSESDVELSTAYYQRVSSLSDSLNFTYGKALANINLGILHSSSGNYESSAKAFLKAMELARACGSRRIEAVALNNIGENFASMKDFDKCRRYALEAIQINDSLKAWRGVAINYELLNRCDQEQGMYKSAKANLDKGMPYALMINDNYVSSMFYLGYGKLHAIFNRNDSAQYYFDKAITTARQTGDLRNEFQVYLAEAKYLQDIPDRNKINLLMKALQLAQQTHFVEGMAKTTEQLSSVYNQMNNRDSSLLYYRMYRTASDSLFSEHNRRYTIATESEWTNTKKEMENNTLKRKIAFKDILLFLAAIGFLLTLFVAFLLYKSFQAKKLKNESQYKQKITETEMQALRAQMNPHFFFNSLNSIENFIMQNEKKLASDYLNKFARFIRGILDSSTNDLIELNKDLESLQLYIDLEQLRFNNKFIYICQVDPQLQDGEYRVPALLVQPFLENAINHGIGPSDRKDLKICLEVKLHNNKIHYIIEDNGIGREQSALYNRLNKPFHKSVGMKLTQERINIFNQEPGNTENLKIIDLYDEDHKPTGTRIEFALKVLNHASAQGHID